MASGDGFGVLLRRYRLASGLSQEELAERSGLSVHAIANMERGRTTRPYRRSVRSLADALALGGPQRERLDAASRVIADGAVMPGPAAAGPGIGRTRPPLAVPHQLPAAVRDFAGRAGELKALTGMLSETAGNGGAVIISAIGGTAGVGKTALAVHWAHQVAERFPDGQLYVNLRGYDPGQPMTAADALAGFLRALGMPGQDIPAETGERAACYRSLLAGRAMIVLLDNAREAEQVRPLLPGTRGCVAIVTSRDALAGLVSRDGARRVNLDLLPLADAVDLLRALIGARVDADPSAAAMLVAHCCRLPLALRVAAELAAAHPAAPLAELAVELADQRRRLDMLDASQDQRTSVRAVFSWSYQHLDSDTARAFRLLGLHPGVDFDSYAAAALTGTTMERVHHLLGTLARAYLIQPARQGRHGMHDLLRTYAAEHAIGDDAEPDRRAALTRLFNHYLHTAGAAMDTLYPAEQQHRPRIPPAGTPVPPVTGHADAATEWLDAHREVLLAAAADAADDGWPGHATRLAATLFRHLDSGGHHAEALALHGHARRAASRAGDRAAEATALNGLGVAEMRCGRWPRASSHLLQALALFRETADRTGEARTVVNLGLLDYQRGRYRDAADHDEQALDLWRQMGDRAGEATALSNLGCVEQRLGRYQQAAGHLQRAIALFRESGDRHGEAYALGETGNLCLRQGEYQQAAEHQQQALALFRETGDRTGEAHTLADLGAAEHGLGRHPQAATHQRQALALIREIGERSGEAVTLNRLGEALLAIGEPGQARRQHTAALSLARRLGDKDQQARAHDGLARTRHAAGDPARARHHWEQALTLYTDLGAPEASQVQAELAAADDDGRTTTGM